MSEDHIIHHEEGELRKQGLSEKAVLRIMGAQIQREKCMNLSPEEIKKEMEKQKRRDKKREEKRKEEEKEYRKEHKKWMKEIEREGIEMKKNKWFEMMRVGYKTSTK